MFFTLQALCEWKPLETIGFPSHETSGVGLRCMCVNASVYSLEWRHYGRDDVSNHQPPHCLLNRLFGHRSNKTLKLYVTGLCVENFPAKMASNAENVPIWWRHHVFEIPNQGHDSKISNTIRPDCCNVQNSTCNTLRNEYDNPHMELQWY